MSFYYMYISSKIKANQAYNYVDLGYKVGWYVALQYEIVLNGR